MKRILSSTMAVFIAVSSGITAKAAGPLPLANPAPQEIAAAPLTNSNFPGIKSLLWSMKDGSAIKCDITEDRADAIVIDTQARTAVRGKYVTRVDGVTQFTVGPANDDAPAHYLISGAQVSVIKDDGTQGALGGNDARQIIAEYQSMRALCSNLEAGTVAALLPNLPDRALHPNEQVRTPGGTVIELRAY